MYYVVFFKKAIKKATDGRIDGSTYWLSKRAASKGRDYVWIKADNYILALTNGRGWVILFAQPSWEVIRREGGKAAKTWRAKRARF